MTDRLEGARILIYSHDSFGLGHLRRCRAIAHALVDQYKGLSALILSGSPIIGSYDFRARVDFVRIPGVIKLHNGEYTSLGLHIDLDQTLTMRESIIRHTAETFKPDLFLVDKEPLGLHEEVAATLAVTRQQGARNIVGLRDIMDDDSSLQDEWRKKQVMPALENLYDEIWIYGIEQMGNPLSAVNASPVVQNKSVFTGYLPRTVPQDAALANQVATPNPFILVTVGGGGDGGDIIDWVLRAYESDNSIPCGALIVLGPFMPPQEREGFLQRVAKLDRVQAITFDSRIEVLMERSAGVVAMGGYNTFCEILSLNKPAVLLPRTKPRKEQYIRAHRAQKLGLVSVLDVDGERPVSKMVTALRELPDQTLPCQVLIPGLLNGFEVINRHVKQQIDPDMPDMPVWSAQTVSAIT